MKWAVDFNIIPPQDLVWRPRWDIRRLKTSPEGRPQVALGFRMGYWPCLYAPYVQLTIGLWLLDLWCGHRGYEKKPG